MKFTEDTRVKIAVLLHLIRLGYSYLSLKTLLNMVPGLGQPALALG
ncbi:hypothetical protein [Serratia quinivorans]|nr:hypothetical protein [Serratia quinivorans]CAI1787338.1 Uncharacterised protein [Serratia quinivorans]CAI1893143.1 Uncharacterised protein [Serratia quinivorans]